MPAPSVTYTFANSTTADATQVNQNFTDLINGASDGTKDYSINALTCAGAATLNGHVTLGSASNDDLTINASLASTISIKTTFSYDIGSAALGLRYIFLGSNDSAGRSVKLSAPVVGTNYVFTYPTSMGTIGQFMCTDGTSAMSMRYPEKTTSKTTTFTGTGDESVILCNAASGAFTVTLPVAASYVGKHYYIKKTDSTVANPVTIEGDGTETIDGSLNTTLNTQFEAIKLVSDGSNWHILERRFPSAWTSISMTGSWIANTAYTCYFKRAGDSIHMYVEVALTGAPTAATLTINTPYTMDNTKYYSSNVLGSCTIRSAGTVEQAYLEIVSTTALRPLTAAASIINATTPRVFANGDYIRFYCIVPIANWKG